MRPPGLMALVAVARSAVCLLRWRAPVCACVLLCLIWLGVLGLVTSKWGIRRAKTNDALVKKCGGAARPNTHKPRSCFRRGLSRSHRWRARTRRACCAARVPGHVRRALARSSEVTPVLSAVLILSKRRRTRRNRSHQIVKQSKPVTHL